MGSNGRDKTNENWVKGLKDNSSVIFEQVFREMSPKLYRFALTYTMNEDMAEDIVQDTFMHLWAVAASLPDDTNINSYLYSSVKNSCLNYYKHLQVEDSNRTKLTEALVYLGSLEYEDDGGLFEKVQACLQQLPGTTTQSLGVENIPGNELQRNRGRTSGLGSHRTYSRETSLQIYPRILTTSLRVDVGKRNCLILDPINFLIYDF